MTRRPLLRWAGWFTAANVGLCFLVGLRYLFLYQWPDSGLGIAYAPLAMLGNFALLFALGAAVLLGPLVAVGPLRRTVMTVAVVAAALAVALLVLDTNVYAERRMHLSMFIAVLFEPVTWVAAGLVFAVALAFEATLAGMLWRWLGKRPAAGGRWVAALLAGSWVASQALHVWADATGYSPVTRFTQAIPLYYPQTAKRRLARLGLIDPARVREASLLRHGTAVEQGELRYPLAPLSCEAPAERPNVLWIVVDGLRPDALDAALTPALDGLRAESLAFGDHWSPGNSSRMAAFGMFYGLPSTYFESFYVAERPPVLLEEFRAQGYEIRAASSKGFGSPTQMDRTVLAGVASLESAAGLGRVEGNAQVARNLAAWLAARRDARPFFALLWLDHSDYDIAPAGTAPRPDGRYAGKPEAQARWDRYRRGLQVIDGQIGGVLQSLERAGLDSGTVVLMMGDHGFEFDELGLGYYGHASNYAGWQLRTPLMIRWPGREPRAYTHRSSHLDLPATLLEEILGCRNDPADYGVGRNLFDGKSWEWMIAGSYHSFAIVEPERIVVSTPGGLAQVLGPDYREAEGVRLDPARIEQAIAEMRRFYR
jgi:membrane-anchored protein YejM (alkaline phosphatase superfamily)